MGVRTPSTGVPGWLGAVVVALWAVAGPAPAASNAHSRHACCRVAAGTTVRVELAEQVSSTVQKTGDTFALRLAEPVVVDGTVVLPKGTPGVGQVIEAAGPGIGGKPAKMVLAAKYLNTAHGRVPLKALQLARPGRDNSRASQALGVSGLAFAPLSVVGIVVHGGEVVFQPGTVASAKLASAVTLAPVARASRGDIVAAASVAKDAAAQAEGPIEIPPPPAGRGEVVFFRAKSVMGTGQWFNVREGGKVLGKLSNGAYFVHVTTPGEHTYTAKLEPELKDHLTINVDAGEAYFVEGTLTGGLVIGAANLSPSTRVKFNQAAKDLKLAGSPGDSGRQANPPPS